MVKASVFVWKSRGVPWLCKVHRLLTLSLLSSQRSALSMRLPGEMLLYCWGISDKDHSHPSMPSPFSLKAAQSSAGISPQCFRANCTDRSQTATLLFSTLAQPPPPLTSSILSISLSTVATNSYYRVCHVTRELLHPSSFSISPLQFPISKALCIP